MIKFWISIVLLLTLGTLCLAEEKKVEAPAECKYCGMDRTTFAHSRMLLAYADGSSIGTCSLNCAVISMRESKGKQVKSIQAADYNTKKLTDAKAATWVIGGNKTGVMTPVAKWAFAEKQDAEAFIKQHGGDLASFDDALKATEKELGDEIQHAEHQKHMCNCGHKM